MYFYALIDSVI